MPPVSDTTLVGDDTLVEFAVPSSGSTSPEEGGRVLIASSGGPLTADPSWTAYDMMDDCRCASYEWSRGRQDEFDVTNTGTARVTFKDRNGTFADGASWIGKQIVLQLWHPLDLAWEGVFRGHIDDVTSEPSPENPELADRVLHCVDIFDYLAGARFVATDPITMGDDISAITDREKIVGGVFYDDEPADDRLIAILDDFGIDPEMYIVFTLNVEVAEDIRYQDDDALSAIRDVLDAEFPSGVANAYVDRLGRVAAHGRFARFDPDNTADGANWDFTRWAAATREDVTTGRAQIREFSVSAPRTRIINSYLAWPRVDEEGFEFKQKFITQHNMTKTDSGSISAHGYRGIEEPSLMVLKAKSPGTNTGEEECVVFAEYYVANYSDPRKNIDNCTFRSIAPFDSRAQDVWDLMCRADVSDIIHMFVDEEGFSDAEFYIEGITGRCEVGNPEYDWVTVTPNLSPIAYYAIPIEGA